MFLRKFSRGSPTTNPRECLTVIDDLKAAPLIPEANRDMQIDGSTYGVCLV
jgi:hypothetical protein